MCKEHRNSAQCAWLFCHAHLIGETSIKLEYGIQIYFSILSLVLVVSGATFFESLEPFLAAFTGGLALGVFLVVFFVALFAFTMDLRCCLSRSSRNNSSWLGLSTSIQGSAWDQTIARPLMPMRSQTRITASSRVNRLVKSARSVPRPIMLACRNGLLRLPMNCSHISKCSVALRK